MDADGPNLAADAEPEAEARVAGVDDLAGASRSPRRRRPPTSLFDRAVLVIAQRYLASMSASATCTTGVRAQLAGLPSCLADCVTATMVSRYADHDVDTDQRHDSPLLLLDVLGGAVTAVDMSPLVWLGQRRPSELSAFSARLVDALPRLSHLSRLSLGTHGQRFTLPVCSDDVLHRVARCCPGLRHLDVSHNTAVSAAGLTSLCAGCPLLEELLLFDCVLPTALLAGVLQGLPRLRVLGHKEVGAAVLLLWRQGYGRVQDHGHDEDHGQGDYHGSQVEDPIQSQGEQPAPARSPGPTPAQGECPPVYRPCRRTLRLTQVANLGETASHRSKGADEPSRLRCRAALVRALRTLCPDLEDLRVRALDEDVRHLGGLPRLQALELRFHAAAKPSSLGAHTLQFARLHGARLTALTVYSSSLRAQHFDVLGQYCPQLRQLWMRTNFLHLDDALLEPAPPGRRFARLENLSLRVGWDERSVSRLPAAFVRGLVQHADGLRKLYVAANSPDVTDEWLRLVLDAAACAALRTLFVLLPARNAATSSSASPRLALTPDSVRLVLARCPDLEELGNLLVWSFQQEEVRHLQQKLRASNSVLKLVAKETIWR